MERRRRATVLAGVVVATGLLAGCVPQQGYTPASSAGTSPDTAVGSLGAVGAATPAAAPEAPAGDTVPVVRVIDGDTFVVPGGIRVRVLGIDSCEAGSGAGQRATSAARAVLTGTSVTLTREPGVDLDRYGRELRYVRTAGGDDLGEAMVVHDHTAVYAGRNDASASYLARLRGLDADGRACDDPALASTGSTESTGSAAGSTDGTASAGTGASASTPAPRPKPAPRLAPAPAASGGSTSYKNCDAVRAAGAAPITAGQPGYSRKLDRDGDGIACEWS